MTKNTTQPIQQTPVYANIKGCLKGHIEIRSFNDKVWAYLINKVTGRRILVLIPDLKKLDSSVRSGDYVQITGKILIRSTTKHPFHISAETIKPYEYRHVPVCRIPGFVVDEPTVIAKAA
jgi:hypothetical protein